MQKILNYDERKNSGAGMTRKIFAVFFVASIFALAYINLTGDRNLRLVAEQFPEIDLVWRKAFVDGYKMAMSLALFFIDVLLVGPFAWLSYFSDHIVPKRVGLISRLGSSMRGVSFFDLGLLLALDFTIALVAFNFTIINAVDENPVKLISPSFIWWIAAGAFVFWCAATLVKMYSYTSDQRKDLKKYIIKF